MKQMALDVKTNAMSEEKKQDRLEQVLEDGELILNRVHMKLDSIDARQKKIEDTFKTFEGTIIFEEWKLEREVK